MVLRDIPRRSVGIQSKEMSDPALPGMRSNPGGSGQGGQSLRRSSRPNLGIPPARLGAVTFPTGLFSSTHLTATGERMTRTTIVAPPDAVFRRVEDDAGSRSSAAASDVVSLYDEEIKKMQKSVREKLDQLTLLKEMRDEEVAKDGKRSQQLSDVEDGDWEPDDMVNPNFVYENPSTIYGDAQGAHNVPTPRMQLTPLTPLRRSKVLRPINPPPPPPKNSVRKGNQQKQPPPRQTSTPVRGVSQQQPPPQPNPEAEGLDPIPRRMAARLSVPPPQPDGQLADALVQALVTALAAHNKTTERFVARQSKGSSLPSFSGNSLDWPIFAHHYRQSTEDCGFTAAQNMARLEKALQREARRHVRALMIVPENAEEVMTRLQRRYGIPEFVVQALVEIARKTPTPSEGKLNSIVDFGGAVINLVTTIKTLRVPAYLNNPQLLQELVEKLPNGLKLQWGLKSVELGRCTLVHFADWIDIIAEAASKVTIPKLNLRDRKEEGFSAEVEEEVTTSSTSYLCCAVCRKDGHTAASCKRFKRMDVDPMWKLVKENMLCFRCLGKNHNIRDCRLKLTCNAEGCSRRHHTLLHGQAPASTEKEEAVEVNATVNQADGGGAILRIVAVTLYGPGGKLNVNALLDEGSTVTLVSDMVAKSLGLKGPQDPLRLRWTDGTLQTESRSRKVCCQISPLDDDKVKYSLKNVPTVTSLNLPAQRTDLEVIAKKWAHLQKIKFKYFPGRQPVILIGQPHSLLTIARDVREAGMDVPMMTQSKLGWTIHGPLPGMKTDEFAFSCTHEADKDIRHNLEKKSLDYIGIRPAVNTRSREYMEADKMKLVSHCFGGRWELMKVMGAVANRSNDMAEWSEVPTERAIGLQWIPGERAGEEVLTGTECPTKRSSLQLVMLVWDPLGNFARFMIKSRILPPDIWKCKIGGDDELPGANFSRLKSWVLELPKFSRMRIAPVKPMSSPRLRFNAVLMASRIGKPESSRFQIFVATRPGEILENTGVQQSRWLSTKANLADDGTQEGKADLCRKSRRCNGPGFLKLSPAEWPKIVNGQMEETAELDLKKEFVAEHVGVPCFPLPDVGQFSNYTWLVCSTTHVWKFFEWKKSRKKKNTNLRKQWRLAQALADIFWKRWLREFIPPFQRMQKGHGKLPAVEVGDMFESLKRNHYPLGLVTQVYPGMDGVIQVADVKTSTGMFRRPVVKMRKADIKAVGSKINIYYVYQGEVCIHGFVYFTNT